MAVSNAQLKALLESGAKGDDLIAKLMAEMNKPGEERDLTLRVGEKGGVSIYGLSRFPITAYAEQLVRIFAAKDRIFAFIKANAALLKHKRDIPELGIKANADTWKPAAKPATA